MRIILYLVFFRLSCLFFPGYTGYRSSVCLNKYNYQCVASNKSVTASGYNRLHQLQPAAGGSRARKSPSDIQGLCGWLEDTLG